MNNVLSFYSKYTCYKLCIRYYGSVLMDYKREKRILLFFFVLVWLVLFYFAFKQYQQIQNNPSTEDLFTKADTSFLDKKEDDISFEQEWLDADVKIFYPEMEIDPSDDQNRENKLEDKRQNFFKEEKTSFCGDFPCYSNNEFIQLFSSTKGKFEKDSKLPFLYHNQKVDSYLKEIAEKRGYQKYPFAKENLLVNFGKYKIHKEVKESYEAMSRAMQKENIPLHFVSGYRSFDHQNKIFKSKMGPINLKNVLDGTYDEKIMKVLNLSALPGYSKHHTGYAVDFGCGDDYLVYQFADTACYKWMSENNFENAKRFGFIPSYPNGVVDQGPNPEPWEYLWVGKDTLLKKSIE